MPPQNPEDSRTKKGAAAQATDANNSAVLVGKNHKLSTDDVPSSEERRRRLEQWQRRREQWQRRFERRERREHRRRRNMSDKIERLEELLRAQELQADIQRCESKKMQKRFEYIAMYLKDSGLGEDYKKAVKFVDGM